MAEPMWLDTQTIILTSNGDLSLGLVSNVASSNRVFEAPEELRTPG